MGKNTSISWCDHTFNCWWGCFKISPGCQHCYAATFDRRVHGKDTDHWDRAGSRRFMSDAYWRQPLAWNEIAAAVGERHRVFCGSMCDWAEIHPDPEVNRQLDAYRGRLFDLISRTPHLDWLLLTKRIENVRQFLPWAKVPWANVWLGTTAEDQEHADQRLPVLLGISAVVHFASLEPMLGPIDLHAIQIPNERAGLRFSALQRHHDDRYGSADTVLRWVIVGAESGPRSRPCETAWIRAVRDQCAQAGTAFFFKQGVENGTLIQPRHKDNLKGRGFGGRMIEMPYLDGRQHLEFPA